MGLFAERKRGKKVPCVPQGVQRYSEPKLRYHLLKDPKGKQAVCKASTEYIREEIRKEAHQDGSAANTEAAVLPQLDVQGPPPSPQDEGDNHDGPPPPSPSTDNNGSDDDNVTTP